MVIAVAWSQGFVVATCICVIRDQAPEAAPQRRYAGSHDSWVKVCWLLDVAHISEVCRLITFAYVEASPVITRLFSIWYIGPSLLISPELLLNVWMSDHELLTVLVLKSREQKCSWVWSKSEKCLCASLSPIRNFTCRETFPEASSGCNPREQLEPCWAPGPWRSAVLFQSWVWMRKPILTSERQEN